MRTKNHHTRNTFQVALVVLSFFCLMVPQVTASNATQIPEQVAFGITPTQAQPEPESRQYITKTVATNETPQYFNGELDKITESIVISGRVLIFEAEHDNGLWESYHEYKTLQDLELHADTVIIRGALRLPQTNVTIYARELRFEDTNGTTSIDTSPYSLDVPALPKVGGFSGNPGGDITLHLASFFLDESDDERFILHGGVGQKGGQGTRGKSAGSVKLIIDNSIQNGPFSTRYKFTSAQAATYIHWPAEGLLFTQKWGSSSKRQNSGGNAERPGVSGNGGQGGTMTAPDIAGIFSNSSLVGGSGGAAAAFVSGGSPGSPRTINHWRCSNGGGCKINNSYTARSGASFSGTAGQSGNDGAAIELDTEFSWLTAPLLSQSLRYAKDLYLYGYYDEVGNELNPLIVILEDYQDSTEWDQLDDFSVAELTQYLNEAQDLVHQVRAGLDYYGNPLGWVPGLSFEVNLSVYDNEIDTAIDVLWLAFSMQQNINDKQARKTYAQQMVTTLNGEVEGFKDQYQKANQTIANLEPRINQLQTETENLKVALEHRSDELRKSAEEAAILNGIRDSLLELTEHVPLANVATRVAFELPNIDPNKPLLNELANITKDAAWDSASEAVGDTQEISNCVAETGDPEKCAIAKGVRDAQDKAAVAKKQGQLAIDLISGNSASNDAVNAELERILAEDPRWLKLTQTMTDLHERKASLVMDLVAAINTANNTSALITQSLLAMDVFHKDVINTNDVLDPRVIAYTKDMAQRARLRLEKYNYYMRIAYQYRLLRSYPGALDMNSIFDDFCKLQAANEDNDLQAIALDGCDAEQVNMEEEEFKNLGDIYKEQISSITEDIIDEYNTGGGVSQDTGVEFDMPAAYLLEISQNPEGVKLNLVDDLQLFHSSEEDIRIRSIEVIDVQFSSPDTLNYVDIGFTHSGISALRSEGEIYLFQHYQNGDTPRIRWVTRYNGNGSLQGLQVDSSSSKSLIGTIIGNNSENLQLFASPAAWSDLVVKRIASPDFSTDSVSISSMRVRVAYEYTPSVNSIKTLRVAAESISEAAPINVLNADLLGRSAGEGTFIRSYAEQESVSLDAPLSYGRLRFQNWKENGMLISTDPLVEITMDRSKTLSATYGYQLTDASQLLELPVTTLNGSASSTRVFAAALNSSADRDELFGINEPFDVRAELRVGAEYQGIVANIYVVVLYNGTFVMQDSNHNWQVWNGSIDSLVPNVTQKLNAVTPITVHQGMPGFLGNSSLFIGHSSEGGNIHYNSAPLNYSVQ